MAEAASDGLAPLNGSAPHVGVAGYTLGGGLSPVPGRSLGYAADHVRSLEVVTADGELRHVSASKDPELFRALRGGKGSFGVVTSLEMDLFLVERYFGGGLFFAGERSADVLHAWREWVAVVPEQVGSSLAVLRLPPVSELPEPLRGAFVVHVRFSFLGSPEEGERWLAPLREVAPVVFDTVAETPYSAVGTLHMDPVDPVPYVDRSVLLREFPAALVDRLVERVGPGARTPPTGLEIRAPAGRALGAVIDAVGPWAGEQAMVNFLSGQEATAPHEVVAAYGEERYRRLAAVKRTYDPRQMFRLNHTILPDGGSGSWV